MCLRVFETILLTDLYLFDIIKTKGDGFMPKIFVIGPNKSGEIEYDQRYSPDSFLETLERQNFLRRDRGFRILVPHPDVGGATVTLVDTQNYGQVQSRTLGQLFNGIHGVFIQEYQ